VIGSAVGVVAGLLAARAIAGSIGSMLGDIYGIAQRGGDQPVNPWILVTSMAVGTSASVIAAIIPARQAAAVDPIVALQKGTYQTLSAPENRLRVRMAAGLVVLLLAGLFVTRVQLIPIAGLALTIVIALLLGPQLARTAARLIRPLLSRYRPVEGALAADSLVQTPRRTSATIAALMLSVALVVTFSGIAQATYESLVTWMATTLNPDLFVMPSQSLDVQSTRFPAAMGPEIAGLPGVARVQLLRNARVQFRGTPVMVNAIEMTSVAQTDLREPLQGDRDSMYRRASRGEGVFISDNLARLQHLRAGDMLEVPAPYGAIRLPVVGVVLDYSDQQGSIFMDRQLYIKHWHDDSVNVIRVYADQSGHVATVRQAIITRYAGVRQAFVMTNQQVKGYVVGVIGQWFNLTSIQVILGIVVAVLGILNTMTVSIADRRREFGILRAVGGFRGQVRRTIWIEAISISAIAIVFGLTLGAIDLYYALHIVRENAGMTLTYQFPFRIALMLMPLILASGFVAAIWPAEAGVRGSVVEALEYE
jgi:putative ABC transport system permease protein